MCGRPTIRCVLSSHSLSHGPTRDNDLKSVSKPTKFEANKKAAKTRLFLRLFIGGIKPRLLPIRRQHAGQCLRQGVRIVAAEVQAAAFATRQRAVDDQ